MVILSIMPTNIRNFASKSNFELKLPYFSSILLSGLTVNLFLCGVDNPTS